MAELLMGHDNLCIRSHRQPPNTHTFHCYSNERTLFNRITYLRANSHHQGCRRLCLESLNADEYHARRSVAAQRHQCVKIGIQRAYGTIE